MDKNFISLRNMFGAVQVVMLEFIAEWTGYAPLALVNNLFNSKVTEIDETATYQQLNIKGYAVKKKRQRNIVANVAIPIGRRILAFAVANGNDVLAKEMSITRSVILYGRAVTSLAKAQQIVDALGRMTAAEKAEYGITTDQEHDLGESVVNFRNVLSEPRARAAQRKTATESLPVLVKAASDLLIGRMDNLMENYAGTAFYEDYKNARVIVTQVRHTVIKGNVTTGTGTDLNNVKVRISGKEKLTGNEVVIFEEMTNEDGNFVKSALNPELTYDVSFELDNYVTQTFNNIDLTRGITDRLDVEMVKIPVG